MKKSAPNTNQRHKGCSPMLFNQHRSRKSSAVAENLKTMEKHALTLSKLLCSTGTSHRPRVRPGEPKQIVLLQPIPHCSQVFLVSGEGSGFHFHFPNDNAKGQFQAAPSLGVLPVNANQRAQGGWEGISGQWKRVGDLSPVSWLQGLAHSRGGVPGSQQPEPHLRLTSLLSSGHRRPGTLGMSVI